MCWLHLALRHAHFLVFLHFTPLWTPWSQWQSSVSLEAPGGLGSLFRWFTLLRYSNPCPHLRRWPLVTLSPARISLSLEFRKQIPHLQGMSLWSLSRSCMSRPQCITPSPGITCFISMDATNAFPCPMLYLPSVSDSFLNLYLFIFQIMRSLSLSSFLHYHFQFSTTVFPKTSLLSASPVHSLSLCCWAGRILAGVSGFQREQSQAECDRKRLPDSAKAINIMLFPMFLLQKKKKIIPAAEIIPCAAKNMFL